MSWLYQPLPLAGGAGPVVSPPDGRQAVAFPDQMKRAPIWVLSFAVSLLGSTLAPAQPLPPYDTRSVEPPVVRTRPTIHGFTDGGRIALLLSLQSPPQAATDLPLRRRSTLRGFTDSGRAIYAPSDALPPGRAALDLPVTRRATLLTTVSSEPVTADQDPPARTFDWPVPRGTDRRAPLRAFTQDGIRAVAGDPFVQEATALPDRRKRTVRTDTLNTIPLLISVKPVGRDTTALPAPRRAVQVNGLTWVQSPDVPPTATPAGRGATVLPDRRKLPVRDWILPTPLVLAVTPPPPDFNHLCVHVVGTWPRWLQVVRATPDVTLAGAWPRVVVVSLAAPSWDNPAESWPRVVTVSLLGCPDD